VKFRNPCKAQRNGLSRPAKPPDKRSRIKYEERQYMRRRGDGGKPSSKNPMIGGRTILTRDWEFSI